MIVLSVRDPNGNQSLKMRNEDIRSSLITFILLFIFPSISIYLPIYLSICRISSVFCCSDAVLVFLSSSFWCISDLQYKFRVGQYLLCSAACMMLYAMSLRYFQEYTFCFYATFLFYYFFHLYNV